MKQILAFLIVGLSLNFSFAKSVGNKAPAVNKVRFILNWKPEPEFGGFYAAQLNGTYQAAGLDVEILPGGVGTPAVQMVEGGKAEFGISSADEVILSRSKGAELKGLYAVYQTSPLAILTHAERGFRHLEDVFKAEGSLAAERGNAYMKFLEKKYGFAKLKVVPYLGGVSQLLTDKKMSQQSFITAEPILARKQGAKPQAFLVAESGFNPYIALIVAKESYVKANPDVVKAFVEASRKGWQDYLNDPAPANKRMAELNTTMDIDTFAEGALAQAGLIATSETKKNKLGFMSEARWKAMADQLVDLKIIDKALPAKTYFEQY